MARDRLATAAIAACMVAAVSILLVVVDITGYSSVLSRNRLTRSAVVTTLMMSCFSFNFLSLLQIDALILLANAR